MYIVLLSFTLYYDTVTSSCRVVANSIYPYVCIIVTTRKVACIYQYVVTLSLNLYSVVFLCPPVVRLSVCKLSRVHSEVHHPEWRY